MNISFMEGPEWEVDLKWHDDDDQFAIFFGEDIGFIYNIADGPGSPCSDCGLWHAPYAPCAPTEAFLERFILENVRLPHWCDLTANCAQDHRDLIREYLDARGQWSEPREGMTAENTMARTVGGMAVHTKAKDPRSMVKVVQPTIRRNLSEFVGMPNDERARAAMLEAVHEAVRPLTKDAKVEVSADPLNEDVIRVKVLYEPVMAPREVRVVDAVVATGVGKLRGKDGEGFSGSKDSRSATPTPTSRGKREDSSDVSSSGGKPV